MPGPPGRDADPGELERHQRLLDSHDSRLLFLEDRIASLERQMKQLCEHLGVGLSEGKGGARR